MNIKNSETISFYKKIFFRDLNSFLELSVNIDNITNIKKQFCRIIGIERIEEKFGAPFHKAFSQFAPNETENTLVAAYICSLFLSAIFCEFPTEKLHTFVHYAREEFHCFSFNCKMYDKIFSYMNEEDIEHLTLLDKNGNNITRRCTKQDIFEAFDFYTNG